MAFGRKQLDLLYLSVGCYLLSNQMFDQIFIEKNRRTDILSKTRRIFIEKLKRVKRKRLTIIIIIIIIIITIIKQHKQITLHVFVTCLACLSTGSKLSGQTSLDVLMAETKINDFPQ